MNPALSAGRAPGSAPSARLARFWHWWLSSFASLFPVAVRQWISTSDFRTHVTLCDDQIEIFQPGSADTKITAPLDPSDLKASGIRIHQECATKRINLQPLAIAIEPESILTRMATLPLAAERNLSQVIGYELDRLTPFRREQAYFDYRILGRNTATGTLNVEIAVTRRDNIDSLLRQARDLGLQVAGLIYTPIGTVESRRLDIADLGFGHRDRTEKRKVRTIWATTAAVLAAIALATPIAQKWEQLRNLDEKLVGAKRAALDVAAQRELLEAKVSRVDALPQRKWAEMSVLKVLDELSRVLPADTFVSTLEFDGKSVQLQGESGSSTGLVELLEASPMFKQVAFKAPLVKIPQQGGDRFHLLLQLEQAAQHRPDEPTASAIEQTPSEMR